MPLVYFTSLIGNPLMTLSPLLVVAALLLSTPSFAAPEPIIDMHLHALHADDQGPPPIAIPD